MASPVLQFWLNSVKRAWNLGDLIRKDEATGTFHLIKEDGTKYWNKIYTSNSDSDPVNQLWIKEVSITEWHLKRGANLICKFNPSDNTQILDIDYAALTDAIIIALALGDASARDVGTAVGNLVEVVAGGRLPVLDGSLLTGIKTVPVGSIMYWPTTVAPASYLIADGSAVSRIDYAELFAVIDVAYGPGDGATTFQLPDLRGTFIRGLDNGKGIDTGRAIGSFQDDAIETHTHGLTGTASGVAHNHTITVGGTFPGSGATPTQVAKGGNVDGAAPTINTSNASSSISLEGLSTAATGSTETRPKNVSLLPCIRFE